MAAVDTAAADSAAATWVAWADSAAAWADLVAASAAAASDSADSAAVALASTEASVDSAASVASDFPGGVTDTDILGTLLWLGLRPVGYGYGSPFYGYGLGGYGLGYGMGGYGMGGYGLGGYGMGGYGMGGYGMGGYGMGGYGMGGYGMGGYGMGYPAGYGMASMSPGYGAAPAAGFGYSSAYVAPGAMAARGRILGIDEEPVVLSDGKKGMKITNIYPGTGAERAGLQVGDVLRSVNGYLTEQRGNLAWIIANATPGNELKMVVRTIKDGKDHSVQTMIQ